MQNRIKIKKQVKKFIVKQDRPTREGLTEILKMYPLIDIRKLSFKNQNVHACYRKFRIVFERDFENAPTAIMAGVRGDIYKHLRSRRKRIEEMRKKEAARYARKFG